MGMQPASPAQVHEFGQRGAEKGAAPGLEFLGDAVAPLVDEFFRQFALGLNLGATIGFNYYF